MISCKILTELRPVWATRNNRLFHIFIAFALLFSITSCRTIAYFDADSFVKTAELKAKTLVVISHADEDYSKSIDKIDDIMVRAETLYAMQKARELNYITTKQWELLIRKTPPGNTSILPDFFEIWKKRGKLNEFEIKFAKAQVEAAFDEILKLESSKLKNNSK